MIFNIKMSYQELSLLRTLLIEYKEKLWRETWIGDLEFRNSITVKELTKMKNDIFDDTKPEEETLWCDEGRVAVLLRKIKEQEETCQTVLGKRLKND